MCHFLILSYATFGHCCTWAKSLRSLRSSQHPYSRKITGQFSWVNRYFWHRRAEPGQSPRWGQASPPRFACWPIHSLGLCPGERLRLGREMSQGSKSNTSDKLDRCLLFLGLALLCLTRWMSAPEAASEWLALPRDFCLAGRGRKLSVNLCKLRNENPFYKGLCL